MYRRAVALAAALSRESGHALVKTTKKTHNFNLGIPLNTS